jgi:hypothetical protein
MLVLCALVNTTPNPETAAVSSGPKIGHSSTKTQQRLHYAIDKKPFFFRVKFEVRFVIYFTRKTLSNKK